jgi:hypothetical protein
VGVNPEGESIKPEDENDETKGEENGRKVERTIYIDTGTGTRVDEIKIGNPPKTNRSRRRTPKASPAPASRGFSESQIEVIRYLPFTEMDGRRANAPPLINIRLCPSILFVATMALASSWLRSRAIIR